MDHPTCSTCAFFDEAGGQCRRYAPRPKWLEDIKDTNQWEASWPEIVGSDDIWCGEHPDFSAYIASLKAEAVTSP